MNAEVAIIRVSKDEQSWSFLPNYRLVENAAHILDISPANLGAARGLFVLYRIQNKVALQFVGFPGKFGTSIVRDLIAPEKARCLASFSNDDGQTDLIVGGVGLQYFTAKECRTARSTGRVVAEPCRDEEDPLFLQHVQVAAAGDGLAAWYENSNCDVGYQLFTRSMEVKSEATKLLPQEKGGGRFAAQLNPSTGAQQLYVLGEGGRLVMLEQLAVGDDWRSAIEITYPSLEETVKITSFTSHIHVTSDEDKSALADHEVRVSTAVETRLTINGRVRHVDLQGVRVRTDRAGNITIIEQCQDLYPTELTLRDATSSTSEAITMDPSEKVKERIANIADDEKAEEHPMFKASGAKAEDIKNGVDAFKKFNKVLQEPSPTTNSDIAVHDSSATMNLNANSALPAKADGSAGSGLWNWVTTQLDKLKNVLVEWARGAWNIIVEWAGKTWRFIVKTASQVLKGIRWLLEDVLKIPIQAIIDAIGFLFSWSDIVDTHDVLVHIANKGMDWLADGAYILADGVDYFLDDVKKIVSDFATPEEMKDKTFSAETVPETEESKKTDEVVNSPQGNWSSYQIQHGSATHSGNETGGVIGKEITDELGIIVSEVVSNFENLIPTISANIAKLKGAKKTFSIGDILKVVGRDIALACIDGIGSVVKGLLRTLGAIVRTFKKGMNTKIQLPLLSKLYKNISGNDLTALDAMALLIAVPTTLLLKAILWKRPRDIPEIKELLDQIHNSNTVVAYIPEAPVYSSTSAKMHRIETIEMHPAKRVKLNPTGAMVNQAAFPSNALMNFHVTQAKIGPGFDDYGDYKYKGGHPKPPLKRPPSEFWNNIAKWWHGFWDFTFKYGKDIVRLGAIAGGWFSALYLPVKIFSEDFGRPTFDWKFYAGLTKDLVIFFGTCPFNPFIPGPTPMPVLRGLNWGLGAINILVSWMHRRARAAIGFGVGVLQAFLEVIILVGDWMLDEALYQQRRPTAQMVLHSVGVVCAQIVKISGAIAVHTKSADGISGPLAMILSPVPGGMNLLIYGLEYKREQSLPPGDKRKEVHIISLLGV